MQRKLATWADNDKTKRFDRLMRLISQTDWLREAARITLSAKGANTPGIDGITQMHLQQDLDSYLMVLSNELLSGDYQPQPARRIYIPKANGKQRPLGIPTLRDRIVQRAMLMVMEPIWESDFHPLSYGFRPERSVHHAIRTVKLQLTDCRETRGRWVIEGDLSSYFDTVHHKLLMQCVRKRINCRRFLNLLWRYMKAGHVEKNLFCATHQGVPQGGVISPLLSNIMLNEFDQYLNQCYLSKKARKDRWYWNNSIKRGRKPLRGETRYTTKIYDKIDRAVFWRLAHWLGSKFKASIKSLMKTLIRRPSPEQAKTWTYFGKTNNGVVTGASLFRLVSSTKMQFRWRLPESNPYGRVESRNTVTSKYKDVAMAVGHN